MQLSGKSGMAVSNSCEKTLCQTLRTHKRHFVCSRERVWGAGSRPIHRSKALMVRLQRSVAAPSALPGIFFAFRSPQFGDRTAVTTSAPHAVVDMLVLLRDMMV
jgi:hypothetical protein